MRAPLEITDALTRLRLAGIKRSGRPSGVLILSCGGLGDTVLFSHVLPRFVELAEPGEKTAVLLRADGAKTAFLFPSEVERIVVDFGRLRDNPFYRWRVSEDLFRRHFRLVVSTDFKRHPQMDEALMFAAQAGRCVAMRARPWKKHQRRLDANRERLTKEFESGGEHVDKVLRWCRFADWLTGARRPPPLASAGAGAVAPPPSSTVRRVFMQPFSAVPAKRSPPHVYERMIEAFPGDVEVSITGTKSDLQRNPVFKALLVRPSVSFDDRSFEQIAADLSVCRLVVTVDTAMMHLAISLGAPTLCLASAAYVGETVPYAAEITPQNAHFLYRPMDCAGCLGDCVRPLEDGVFACVAGLDVDRAVAAALNLLDGKAVATVITSE